MTRAYAERGVDFVFVYTREAHPGQNYPAHASMAQKADQANALVTLASLDRPMLVDDLDGTLHKAYGMLPNMTYLVSRSGQILYRSDWTDPSTIQAAIDYVLAARDRRRSGVRLKPFYSESVGYRWTDDRAMMSQMAIAGQQAIDDFAQAIEFWKTAPLKGGIEPKE